MQALVLKKRPSYSDPCLFIVGTELFLEWEVCTYML